MSRHSCFRHKPLILALAALGGALPALGLAATITVTGALDDTPANQVGNMTCDLREAIVAANTDAAVGECPAGSGADTIAFNIPGAGPHLMNISDGIAGDLPAITTDVTIDGYTQPGSSVNTLANGTNAVIQVGLRRISGNAFTGLVYAVTGTGTVRGLRLTGFGSGIAVSGGAGNVVIQGNFIGTDGTMAMGNSYGVDLISGAHDVTVGGAALADRNLIAANTSSGVYMSNTVTNVVIRNNLIGTQANGNTKLAGGTSTGISLNGGLVSGVLIRDNVIGAGTIGVYLNNGGSNVQFYSNSIGVGVGGGNIAGTFDGIAVWDQTVATSNVLVGVAGSGNTIANWGEDGVRVEKAGNATPTGITIQSNSIYNNAGQGINLIDSQNNVNTGVDVNDAGDVDTGPNGFQNYPVITSATTDGVAASTFQFTLNGAAATSYRIQWFQSATCDASGNGEGQEWLGGLDFSTDGSGNLSQTVNAGYATTVGNFLTMTATNNVTGETSEFSQCQAIAAAPPAQTPPVMGDVPNQTGTVGTLFSLALVAYVTPTDSDAILSYAATGALPPGIAFNSVAGTFSGTPTTAGVYNVTVTATDNDGVSNTDAIQFTISAAPPAQTPPVMGNAPNQTGTVGTAFSLGLEAYATATNGDAMTYAVVGILPPGLSLHTDTGVIDGTPSSAGIYTVTVSALDNDGASNADAIQFTIDATQQPGDVAAVPTLTEWTLALLSLLTAMFGVRRLGNARNKR